MHLADHWAFRQILTRVMKRPLSPTSRNSGARTRILVIHMPMLLSAWIPARHGTSDPAPQALTPGIFAASWPTKLDIHWALPQRTIWLALTSGGLAG